MLRSVLIADGDAERSQRIAAVCRGAGLRCLTASQGAAALELALAERPALVIAALRLPLVDAVKLAEILRANPHTRAARFVFLDEDPSGTEQGGVGDVLLPASTEPERILQNALDLFERQERIQSLDVVTQRGGVVEGELRLLPLAELLQLFQINRASGRIALEPRGAGAPGVCGTVVVREGEVIRAEVGSIVSEKALFRMLSWEHGAFRFEPGGSAETPVILVPTRTLLREGLRQQEELRRLGGELPALDARLRLRLSKSALPSSVHPLTQEVLTLLESYPRIRDLVDRCSFPDYQVLRTLHTLAQREIVQILQSSGAAVLAPAAGLFDEAQTRRLGEWLRGRQPAEARPRDAKLLVTSVDPECVLDFAQLLARVDGVEPVPELARGRPCADDLTPIARVALEGGGGIELVHVPVHPRFAPLWPLAAHGALGGLVLLSGSAGDASERVSAMAGALAQLPRSRTLHVMLLRKGERVAPDDLRENLSLIDEASLFLLPLESGKHPVALLRAIFGRVVP